MKSRSKRWCAKNGAKLKRNRRNRAKRKATTKAVRAAAAHRKQA
jgi:hypothetical protein